VLRNQQQSINHDPRGQAGSLLTRRFLESRGASLELLADGADDRPRWVRGTHPEVLAG